MLFIYCAGGFGKEVFDISCRAGYDENDITFVDDSCDLSDPKVINFDSFSSVCTSDDEIIVAHGEPRIRSLLYDKIQSVTSNFAVIIDPSSVISPSAKLSRGVIVCPLCSVSSDAIISHNTVINTMSIVGHDVFIGEHSVISSMVNIGGSTRLNNQVYVGMGALIRESLVLNDHCIVSMGSVVHRNVEERHIVQGDPAKTRLLNVCGTIFKRKSTEGHSHA